ncbi:MAG: hypothetical protein JXB85_03780 [Anaerolineales bacterium]|nr:hypothetical protein [Anaerolineales bacterium]
MRKLFAVIARFFAVIFAIVFVILTLTALFLTAVDRRLLDPQIYKEALSEQQVYTRMPRIVAEQMVMSMSYDPCAENPLLCESAVPEFHACVERTLGEDRYLALASGTARPTASELQLIQPCMQQYPTGLATRRVSFAPGENMLPAAPGEVLDCARGSLGEEAYNAIYNEQRPASDQEVDQIIRCYESAGYGVQIGGSPEYLQNLTVGDWEQITVEIVPPEELQGMAENVLDQTFAYLNGQRDTVVISLADLKERIAGEKGLNALLQIIQAQPPCDARQLEEIERMIAGQGGHTDLCQPPEDVLRRMIPILQRQLQEAADGINAQTVLLHPQSFVEPGQARVDAQQQPGAGFRIIRIGMRLSPDLVLFFLLLITLLVVRTLKGWMRWWGIPLFFSGLTSVAFAAMMAAIFEEAWLSLISGSIPPYLSLGLINLGYDLAGHIIHSLLESIVAAGLILGALGLAAWIGSYLIRLDEDGLPLPAPKN